ncbi:hypothetical protein Bbelb_099880 [Branchiostoma belcheri]|nr:hypothetical protein Bbelb_099880 [Branchiostoma belcheri]
MLYNSFSTAATEYGNNNEAAAVEEYVNGIQEEFPGAYCEGWTYPFNGATLAGSVSRQNCGLEVKCVLSKLGMSAEDASQDSKFFLKKVDGSVSLKTTHKYHDQVQGQLYCCELDWVDFVGPLLSSSDQGELLAGPRRHSAEIRWEGGISKQPSHEALTWGPHMGPSHGALTWGPHMGPSHGALTWGPHMGPSHGALTWGPHMGPSHEALTRGPHTRPSHEALTRGPHTRPSHEARSESFSDLFYLPSRLSKGPEYACYSN